MCRYISAFFNPTDMDVRVACLCSHGVTEALLNLSPAGPYREMHYLPCGTVECRLSPDDIDVTADECESAIRSRWPTFSDFETWAIKASAAFYDPAGYDRDGYSRDGYDRDGYDRDGYNRDGYDRGGYDRGGYDRDGYDEDGYDEDGYNEDGYDRDGYDRDGYDEDGYNEDGYDRDGYDRDGKKS